jgi:hypothetical protein
MEPAMRCTTLIRLGAVGVLVGCAGESPTVPSTEPVLSVSPDGSSVTGGGRFEHPTFGRINFSVSANRHHDGTVTGRFEYHYFFATATPTGAPVSYKGDVTCFAVDLVNHRAWIGGVLTHSNDPSPNVIVHEGHDAWFRLVDNGSSDPSSPDRITFIGFEGAAGIPSSEEYCRLQIWPGPPTDPVDARTWPVVSGNVIIN